MFRPPVTEHITLTGPAGDIEGIVEAPLAGSGAVTPACAVICHPHPLGGGTMTNKVVHTLARSFQELGAATLRFNFRGIGASAGQFDNGDGETQDAVAAVAWARARWPDRPLWLAGFSFGSFVALRAAAQTVPALLVTVAPPLGRWDFSTIIVPSCRWLIVQGDRDELVDAIAVRDWAAALSQPPQLSMLAGVDHFFHGRLHDLKATVLAFAQT
jgi:alpha/beta superfamily hydrolase